MAALSTKLSTAALDKHPQSKERGITLDLGFSSFEVRGFEVVGGLSKVAAVDVATARSVEEGKRERIGTLCMHLWQQAAMAQDAPCVQQLPCCHSRVCRQWHKQPPLVPPARHLHCRLQPPPLHARTHACVQMPMPEHLKALPYDELQFTLVDCPGHASLIRTIIGGVQIIDMMILVIDITKGLQAQTAECLVVGEVATSRMAVVLNKVDMLPEEDRAKVRRRARVRVHGSMQRAGKG